jgi:5-methylcytosine-specific restriction enzyme A
MPGLHVCARHGCPKLTDGTWCEEHQGEAARNDKRYGTQRWRLYSQRRLATHPFCANCGLLADVTDHILAVRTHPHLFWVESNHQSLCTTCNTTKGQQDANAPRVNGDEPPRDYIIA